jgi:hypothetical protein
MGNLPRTTSSVRIYRITEKGRAYLKVAPKAAGLLYLFRSLGASTALRRGRLPSDRQVFFSLPGTQWLRSQQIHRQSDGVCPETVPRSAEPWI